MKDKCLRRLFVMHRLSWLSTDSKLAGNSSFLHNHIEFWEKEKCYGYNSTFCKLWVQRARNCLKKKTFFLKWIRKFCGVSLFSLILCVCVTNVQYNLVRYTAKKIRFMNSQKRNSAASFSICEWFTYSHDRSSYFLQQNRRAEHGKM